MTTVHTSNGLDWPEAQAVVLEKTTQWDHYSKWRDFTLSFGKPIFLTVQSVGFDYESTIRVSDRVLKCIARSFKSNGKQWCPPPQFVLEIIRNEILHDIGAHTRRKTLKNVVSNRPNLAEFSDFQLAKKWRENWVGNLQEIALQRVRTKCDPADFQIWHLYKSKSWGLIQISQVFKRGLLDILRAIWRLRQHWLAEIRQVEKDLFVNNSRPMPNRNPLLPVHVNRTLSRTMSH